MKQDINMVIENFHFIYIDWLWLLLPLALILSWLVKSRSNDSGLLHKLVDPKLAPFVLTGESGGSSRVLLGIAAFIYLVAVIAMAGPSWEKRKQAGFKKEQAVVIALDLSTSMFAKDVQPSRLVRARFELIDLLNQRKEGLTALIVYAGDAFSVSPLTDDTDTIEAQAKLLDPNIMPIQGSQASLAIKKSAQLLEQSEVKEGQILLVTDEVADINLAIAAAKDVQKKGFQVSILSIGTEEGSPIPLPQGGFIKDSQDNIVLAKVNVEAMQQVIQAGGGLYVASVVGDQDLSRLLLQFSLENPANLVKSEDKEVESWINEGAWLVLLLLPLGLLAFRKGVLASVVVIFFVLPQPQSAVALEWNDLWFTADQQGQESLNNGEHKQAAEKFENPSWKAAAEYKAGNYQKALENFSQEATVEGQYNKANTLVKLKKIPEAIKAYEDVLKQDKGHEDAKYNLALLKKAQEQQQQGQQQENKKQQQDSEQKKPDQEQQGKPEEKQNADQQKPSENGDEKTGEDAPNAEDKKAEEAEKEALDEWKKQEENKDKKEEGDEEQESEELSEQQREQKQATEQWLRRIPDDPSGLWRRKFKYQYGRRNQQGSVGKPW